MKTRKTSDSKPRRKTPADSAGAAALPPNSRTRIGNGSRMHAGVDGRSTAARRWKEIYLDAMSRTDGRRIQLCRQLASLVVARERLDGALANGQEVDVLDLVRCAGAINRTMMHLGLAEPAPDPLPADAPSWLIGPRAPEGAAP
jgi:hypothetical protein